MYSVESCVKVRRAVMTDERSEREVSLLFGIHRKTVKNICQYVVPSGYQRKSEPISLKIADSIEPRPAQRLSCAWLGHKALAEAMALASDQHIVLAQTVAYPDPMRDASHAARLQLFCGGTAGKRRGACANYRRNP